MRSRYQRSSSEAPSPQRSSRAMECCASSATSVSLQRVEMTCACTPAAHSTTAINTADRVMDLGNRGSLALSLGVFWTKTTLNDARNAGRRQDYFAFVKKSVKSV